ncbi:MAG: RelA/SpoT family protein [Candidatus Woesearchaeota archaeon]
MKFKHANNLEELLEWNDMIKNDLNHEMIEKAYMFSKKFHTDKTEDSIKNMSHPLSVATILLDYRVDTITICAALMHDLIEHFDVTEDEIMSKFGKKIAFLISSITKIQKHLYENLEERNIENQRKVILSSFKDFRVMYIKLADRLHIMRTLDIVESEEKRFRISEITRDVYVPIAEKVGLNEIKSELADLSLKYLDNKNYLKIKDQISDTLEKRKKDEYELKDKIDSILNELKIEAKLEHRLKSFYSIYKKMVGKNKNFEDIYDLIGFRIITKSIDDCYKVFVKLKEEFNLMEDRIKDYIKNPKKNGYRSLHMTVDSKEYGFFEIQIRTEDMHYKAETGIAAHWRYKDIDRDVLFDRRIELLKILLDWKKKLENQKIQVTTLKNDIVVFTPKADPIILHEESTVLDFAYAVHTSIGNRTSQAIVNGKTAPLDSKLKNGDVVRIITNKTPKAKFSWLNIVTSSKARAKIRSFLGIEGKDNNSNESEKIISLKERVKLPKKYSKSKVKIAGCCKPKMKNKIGGVILGDKTISVHKRDCVNYNSSQKKIKLEWKEEEDDYTSLKIVMEDDVQIMLKLLDEFAKSEIELLSVSSNVKREKIHLHIKTSLPKKLGKKVKKIIQNRGYIYSINLK